MTGNHKNAQASRKKNPAPQVYTVPSFAVDVSKGVMSKDGVTPYAPGTIMAGAERDRPAIVGRGSITGLMMSPYDFTVETLLGLLISEDFTHITVITDKNNQFTIVKEPKNKG